MSESPTLVRLVKEKNSRSKNRSVPSLIGSIDPGHRIATAMNTWAKPQATTVKAAAMA